MTNSTISSYLRQIINELASSVPVSFNADVHDNLLTLPRYRSFLCPLLVGRIISDMPYVQISRLQVERRFASKHCQPHLMIVGP